MSESRVDTECCRLTVAIVGGGFTGAVCAAQLLRQSGGAIRVALIEKAARAGTGVAYGTRCAQHLLNVQARNMSAFPDDPEHFLRWARLNHELNVKGGDFLPRQLYGQYVASVLRQEIERHPGQFEHVQDEAVSVSRSGGVAEIKLRNGQRLSADKVVLALGNFPPGDPRLPGRTPHSQRYVANPWTASALNGVESEQSVLLVGSGLTSVDVGIGLRAQGFTGTIHTLSRRGLLPQTHQVTSPWPPFWSKQSARTPLGILRLIRKQIEKAEQEGSDWRAVIDSLRPFTQEIWSSLELRGQRGFLRHARAYWDVHRHRVAPEIGLRLSEELMSGRTETHAGRVEEYREDVSGVDVSYRDRKTGELCRLRVDRVINCTGPEGDFRKLNNPLMQDLMRNKLVRPDPLFLGLAVSKEGALIDAHGVPSDFLYTAGPARKGRLWESIAVPELRVQAMELAKLLLASRHEEESRNAGDGREERLAESLR